MTGHFYKSIRTDRTSRNVHHHYIIKLRKKNDRQTLSFTCNSNVHVTITAQRFMEHKSFSGGSTSFRTARICLSAGASLLWLRTADHAGLERQFITTLFCASHWTTRTIIHGCWSGREILMHGWRLAQCGVSFASTAIATYSTFAWGKLNTKLHRNHGFRLSSAN